MRGETALLIIDMLNDFVLEGAPLEVPETRTIIPFVRRKLKEARKAGLPVIFVCDHHRRGDPEFEKMHWPPHAIGGTHGAEVIKELKPKEGEVFIKKTTYSGFFQTALDKTLRRLGVTDLWIAGCVTNICILYTVADAVMRGYSVKVLREGVAGLDTQEHEFALQQMRDVLGVEIR
jgi:nicotinamidase-related amidase